MKYFILFILTLSSLQKTMAQSIRGRVVDEETQTPLRYVSVYIPDLRSGAATDSLGNFGIKGLPAGSFLLEVTLVGYSSRILRASTQDNALLEITLSPTVTEMHELVVTGSTSFSERERNPVPIIPVKRELLLQNSSSNLIEGITKLPGMNQVSTGPAISKPVIRGLGYNRVVVLRNGIRQEGQQWGDEHGVEIDEYEVDRVEIVKGPGSLLYGSDAMAGVVNFLTPRPAEEGTLRGEFLTGYQSNGNLIGNSVMHTGTRNGFNWLARVSQKKAGNYSNSVDGHVLNSGFEELDASGHLGLNRKWGYSQLQFSAWSQKLGLVEGERDNAGNFLTPVIRNDTAAMEAVAESDRKGYEHSIGIPYQRISHYRAVLTNSFYLGESNLQVTLAWQQNQRKEYGDVLTPNATDLYFRLNTYNLDVKYFFPEKNDWKITIGASSQYQGNQNYGADYLIPAYQAFDAAAFGFIQKEIGKWFLSGGLRVDGRQLHSEALYLDGAGIAVEPAQAVTTKFSAFDRNFSNITGSAGLSYKFSERTVVRLNVSRGFRTPNLSELGSNGKHEGTFRYEKGNPDLLPETSFQGDVGISFNTRHVSIELNGFYNHIQNYIYLEKLKSKSGADSIADPLDPAPVFNFVQGNATLYGGEISVDIHPHPLDQLHFENAFSIVRGIQLNQPDSLHNLPFMPAPKFQSEVRWQWSKPVGIFSNLYAKADVNYFFEQLNVFAAYGTETPTPSYFVMNLGAGWKFVNAANKPVLNVFLSCNNLLDNAYQSHLSRLKYAPVNPVTGVQGVFNSGRNVTVKIVIPF